ncbi:DUF5329 family protein [Ramlibacter sp. G-1-2-2]|uniref:DUF5329 family protein n=1 Tax=Ramlibacter agri TaxID=2728837 RepID=A0A848HBD3_9BURK|nr:DUF5329 family protein [Ramlibacter agri]
MNEKSPGPRARLSASSTECTPASKLAPEALRAWANSRLGKTPRISQVHLLRELPCSAIGKVLKRELQESSMSGTPYLVRCGTNAPVQSGAWLRAELGRYRAAARP